MTGEEFVKKLDNAKEITDFEWCIKGNVECPDSARVSFLLDGERMTLLLGKPVEGDKPDYSGSVWIALVIKKMLKLRGISPKDFSVGNGDNISDYINYARECIEES